MKHLILVLLLLASCVLQAQIKAVVLDSVTRESIPFVNIWIEDEDLGTSADENGYFTIEVSNEPKVLAFSAVGYETKRLVSEAVDEIVELSPNLIHLSEVVVRSKKKYREYVIGSIKKSKVTGYFEGVQNPLMPSTLFEYNEEYAATPYLKEIKFVTNSSIQESKFNVRLYSVNKQGMPDQTIYDKNIIGIAKKGKNITRVDVSDLNIKFPDQGLIIAFEFLIIASNIDVVSYQVSGSDEVISYNRYLPLIGIGYINNQRTGWIYERGGWYSLNSANVAIELVLMN